MLREFFLYLSQAAWAQRAVTRLWLGRKMAQRFVADRPSKKPSVCCAA